MPFFSKKHPEPVKMIAIASGKGGVGKSTVANNLAIELAASGYRVGLLDADIYGPSQPNLLGEQQAACAVSDNGQIIPIAAHGIHFVSITSLLDNDGPVIWRAPIATRVLVDLLTKVKWPDLDYLLIDLPPGTGDIQITLAQKADLFGAIVVTTPQHVAANIAQKAVQLFEKVEVPVLGLVENMSHYICAHCHESNQIFHPRGRESICAKHDLPILTQLPLHQDLAELSDQGKAITTLDTAHPVRQAYAELIKQFLGAVDAQQARQSKTNVILSADKKSLTVTWPDRTTKIITAFSLRLACACANCVDEITGTPILDPSQVPADIKIKKFETVGSYGIKPVFSDGHQTGIFAYQALRQVEQRTPNTTPAKPVNTTELSKAAVQAILDQYLNPQIADHDGRISVTEVRDKTVYVQMAGGCQGCSQSEVTLKNGVVTLVKRFFPQVNQVVDITEHAMGENPFY